MGGCIAYLCLSTLKTDSNELGKVLQRTLILSFLGLCIVTARNLLSPESSDIDTDALNEEKAGRIQSFLSLSRFILDILVIKYSFTDFFKRPWIALIAVLAAIGILITGNRSSLVEPILLFFLVSLLYKRWLISIGLPVISILLLFIDVYKRQVTGSVGSGKSTTLASIVDFINQDRHDHIITLEDPIEYLIPSKNCHVNQREVHKHTESFARALRGALREDPDVIMVGEMRDLETISLALTAAETGHLVLGTLHTDVYKRQAREAGAAFSVP